MKTIDFYKYQGTGNDFVMINNTNDHFDCNASEISYLCSRRFGIGADGLILLGASEDTDFEMVYYNADGKLGTMCGNGARCAVAFARDLGLTKKQTTFRAIDGKHTATISGDQVHLKMADVENITAKKNETNTLDCILDTGSPHYVKLVEEVGSLNVVKHGAALRYSKAFPGGINVNFVEKINPNIFKMRTYERGVEAETFACGTGATAVALAMFHTKETAAHEIKLEVKGGVLEISFEKKGMQGYQNIFLKGDAKKVFRGTISL